MAISKIMIVNAALILCGQAKLTSLTDNSKAARLANDMYEVIRDQILGMNVNWKFCTTRAELAQLDDAPAFGTYDYQYALPANCKRILATVDEDGDDYEYEWVREVYIDGSTETDVILCNEENVYVKYIVLRGDPRKYPAWFSELIITKLAMYLAEPLKQNTQIQKKLEFYWEKALKQARESNAAEDVTVDSNNYRDDYGNDDVTDAAVHGSSGRVLTVDEIL